MQPTAAHRTRVGELDDLAEIHHRDAVGDVPHQRQVVRDEQVGDAEAAAAGRLSRLMTCAWIETSSADTGSSHTDDRRVHRERARDADALALPAGEFVRIAADELGADSPTVSSSSATRRWRAARAIGSCSRSGSPTIDPIDRRGFEARVRVLEDDLHLAPSERSAPRSQVRDVAALEQRRAPRVGSSSRMRQRASVDLPQPDSPTTASVSPCGECRTTRRPARARARAGARKRPRDRVVLHEVAALEDVGGAAATMRRPRLALSMRDEASHGTPRTPPRRSAGASPRQRAMTAGQRGAKLQPRGMSKRRRDGAGNLRAACASSPSLRLRGARSARACTDGADRRRPPRPCPPRPCARHT